MTDLVVFSGRAHPQLTQDICRHLRLPVGQAQVYEFSNENIFVKINENVRGKDVFVVQSLSPPVSTSIMELLIMLDALQARLGQAHHRGHPVLRLRPHRQEGSAARADHRAAAGGLHHGGGREPRADDGSARGPDSGLLQHPGG